jgi:Ca-activated chloride channel family protein
MFRFEHGYYLYLLTLLVVFTIFFIYNKIKRKRQLESFGDPNLVNRLLPDASKYKNLLKFVLFALGFAILVLGIANPQIGTKLIEAKRQGVDVVVALDISNSMKAEDAKPSRLEAAKQYIARLIDKLQGDRISIIVFAGRAYTQLPITTDYSAAKLFLSTIDCDLIDEQGTAIGAAIDLSMETFKPEETGKKALIIISDGENHEDDAVASAEEAAKKGFIINTIGIGSPNGAPIPVYNGNVRSSFLKDNEGNVIMTKLDPSMLKKIATTGGGKFILSGDSDPDLAQLVDQIATMDKKEFESKIYSDYESRFQYFLAAALVILAAEVLFSNKKNRYIATINIFGEKQK